jgi:putative ABC transport system permease protein
LLDGHPYEVVGVLSSSFHFPRLSQLYAMTIAAERPELWKPFAVRPDELESLGDFNFACIGRLRPGVSLRQALAELNAAQAHLASLAPEKIDLSAVLVPLQDQITGRSRSGLQLVMCAVALVLLIGCVNIANLLLARASSRKREIAIRSALGAGAWRLLRQLLAESLLLAGTAGALGVAVAWGALRIILARAPVDLPRLDDVHLDGKALLFAVAISIVAGLLFGVLPSWRLSRIDPQEGIQSGSRNSTEAQGSGKLRSLLVALEVGLSTMCLIAAGLLLRSYVRLLDSEKGFTVQQVITVNLNLPDTRYPSDSQRVSFMRSLLESVRALPGVRSVAVSNMLPLSGEGGNNLITLEGTTVPLAERPLADIRGVNPEYFATLGIPLRQGDIFEDTDHDRKVAVVSALAAARFWPGQNPVGKQFKVGDPDSPFIDVLGVVGDVKSVGLDKPASLTVYLPYWQRATWRGPALAVRTVSGPLDVSSAIRDAVHKIDSELPVPRFQTMEQVVDESVAQRRFQMTLILLFGLAAMMLACLGIYGVVSYSVASRTREMGIRMALGARSTDIVKMILRQALSSVAVGFCAGLAAALSAGRFMAALVYGVTPADTVTMAGVLVTLGFVATVATLIPARRATHVDPATALRYE